MALSPKLTVTVLDGEGEEGRVHTWPLSGQSSRVTPWSFLMAPRPATLVIVEASNEMAQRLRDGLALMPAIFPERRLRGPTTFGQTRLEPTTDLLDSVLRRCWRELPDPTVLGKERYHPLLYELLPCPTASADI